MITGLIIIGAGYLLGAIPFALIISRMFGVPDLRAVGSGNLGATNVYRAAGPVAAILVTVSDIGKGVLPVLLATALAGALPGDPEYFKLAAGGAAIIGHIFPVFLGFRGGKGVNTALGVFLTLVTVETLVALGVFIIVVLIGRMISLGSILASLAFLAVVLFEALFSVGVIHDVYVPTAVVLTALIVITHRTNIKRIIRHQENRFSFHRQSPSEVKNNG